MIDIASSQVPTVLHVLHTTIHLNLNSATCQQPISQYAISTEELAATKEISTIISKHTQIALPDLSLHHAIQQGNIPSKMLVHKGIPNCCPNFMSKTILHFAIVTQLLLYVYIKG